MEPEPRSRPVELLLRVTVLVLFSSVCAAQRLCTVPPGPVTVSENLTLDQPLVQILSGADVTLTLSVNPEDLFYLKGNVLMVKKGIDYESLSSTTLVVWVQCSGAGSTSVNESVDVLVENVNDNPPNFEQNHFVIEVNELTAINSSVALIEASDVDSEPLFYRLESATDKYFRLENINSPKILVKSLLDHDVVQKVSLVLHVQDTFNGSASNKPFFTSVATVTVHVKDVDNRPPWFQPCLRTNVGIAKLCVSSGYRGKVNLTEKEEGPLVLEPGPLFARDGDKNRSEQISYRILRGNEGNLFQIDEDTGNITMTKAADIIGPITLTVLASQVSNRDQFAVTQVTMEVMKRSRNPPRFEKERYEGFIYSNSVPESMILRDRSTNRPFRVRARDEDFAAGLNPDVKYEVQYSSYVNVTSDGFMILKRVVKTESFALQLRAVDSTTGEFGTAAVSVHVIPAVATPSPSNIGYRPGDMALLGLVMAALLVLCLIVIGFLISRLWKGNGSVDQLCECLGPCLKSDPPRAGHRDSLQFTNDGFQSEAEQSRGGGARRWSNILPRRSTFPQAQGGRSHHCSSCGVHTNHVPKGSPSVGSPSGGPGRRGRGDGDEYGKRLLLNRQRRKEGQKTVWFKESEDSSDIEVEIIPDTVGRVEEETEEQLEGEGEMEGVVRDPAAPLRGSDPGQENQNTRASEEQDCGVTSSEKEKEEQEG
ncbi:cadherin-related family member 5 [Platichthys flesus]|uniref:cadherin-related family member 5 n=1 Tax=Platichthys flesus TaxID=8260 RepID=UPI002DBFF45C|nr:cadherin-related family member 5 [Platichthys flesus]